jgi:hypothetical protein
MTVVSRSGYLYAVEKVSLMIFKLNRQIMWGKTKIRGLWARLDLSEALQEAV